MTGAFVGFVTRWSYDGREPLPLRPQVRSPPRAEAQALDQSTPRAPGPPSPPAMTHWMSVRSRLGTGPSIRSTERNCTAAGTLRRWFDRNAYGFVLDAHSHPHVVPAKAGRRLRSGKCRITLGRHGSDGAIAFARSSHGGRPSHGFRTARNATIRYAPTRADGRHCPGHGAKNRSTRADALQPDEVVHVRLRHLIDRQAVGGPCTAGDRGMHCRAVAPRLSGSGSQRRRRPPPWRPRERNSAAVNEFVFR